MLAPIAAEAGVAPTWPSVREPAGRPAQGEAGEGLMLVEFENKPAKITLPSPATDLLTGRVESGEIEIPAYGVMVLEVLSLGVIHTGGIVAIPPERCSGRA